MIKTVSVNIVKYLVSKNIILNDLEIYEYGFNILIGELVNLFSILLISILFHDLFIAIWYFLTFSILRMFMGGYHEKTHLKCFISTNGLYILFIFIMNNNVFLSSQLFMFISITSIVIIWNISPIDTKIHRITEKQYYSFKRINRFICFVFIIILISNFHYKGRLFYTIEIIMIYISILCFVQFCINKKEKKEEKNE